MSWAGVLRRFAPGSFDCASRRVRPEANAEKRRRLAALGMTLRGGMIEMDAVAVRLSQNQKAKSKDPYSQDEGGAPGGDAVLVCAAKSQGKGKVKSRVKVKSPTLTKRGWGTRRRPRQSQKPHPLEAEGAAPGRLARN
jgi:hypothetical protein